MLDPINHRAVFVHSVLEQRQQGAVYVNSMTHPTSALITSSGGFYCLLGTAVDSKFNEAIIQFLNNPSNHKINFYALALFSDEWSTLLDKHELIHAKKISRTYFSFNKEKFVQRYLTYSPALSEGYQSVGLDQRMAKKYSEDFYSYYSVVWSSDAHFIDNGVAHFVTLGQDIVSVCSSPYVGGGYAEIDIITVEEHRRKGLATSVGVQFIKECMSRGLTPNWCCHADNKSSLDMALQLGFELHDEHPMYWYNG